MAKTEQPLRGRRVLVTRPGRPGDGLARRLVELGADAQHRPTIALEALDEPTAARQALERLADYDWIVFTSSNGVRFFFELLRETGSPLPEPPPRVASIGPATSRALSENGLPPTVEATDSRAEGLAAALGEQARSDERALLVRPEAAREVLPQMLGQQGVHVDAVPFYRNVPAAGLDEVVRELCAGNYDAVVLSAPSTLTHLIDAAERKGSAAHAALSRVALVAIGEVTAAALRDADLEPSAVAAEPSDEAIAEALCRLFAGA
jgi:uroporphyrinogen-III synthase